MGRGGREEIRGEPQRTRREPAAQADPKGKTGARRLRSAHVLLLADEGRTDEEVSSALGTVVRTVERARKRFVVWRTWRHSAFRSNLICRETWGLTNSEARTASHVRSVRSVRAENPTSVRSSLSRGVTVRNNSVSTAAGIKRQDRSATDSTKS
jgi:hypothetical protein